MVPVTIGASLALLHAVDGQFTGSSVVSQVGANRAAIAHLPWIEGKPIMLPELPFRPSLNLLGIGFAPWARGILVLGLDSGSTFALLAGLLTPLGLLAGLR